MILFPTSIKQNSFVLGNQITLKYPFVFNSDSGVIGLYTGFSKESNIKNNEKNFFIKFAKLIIIIFLSIILIVLGIIIGKKIYGIKRKKRANELLDDYEYNSNEKNNNKNETIN